MFLITFNIIRWLSVSLGRKYKIINTDSFFLPSGSMQRCYLVRNDKGLDVWVPWYAGKVLI